MHLPALLLLPLTTALALPTQVSLSRIPTMRESASLARHILRHSSSGVLSTIFPSSDTLENRPSNMQGVPIGLPDYIADCETLGNPTILAIGIATTFKNAAAGSNVSLAISSADMSDAALRAVGLDPRDGAMNQPRFALMGYLERMSEVEVAQGVEECFARVHPDARLWMPGNMIHESWWARLVVSEVYWVGGFGDRAYIGWIDGEAWRHGQRDKL